MIAQEAETSKPDLLVIGSHTQDGIGELSGERVTYCLHSVACPVLILR